MALPPLITPLPKSHWLPLISANAKATVAELDSKPRAKALLASFRQLKGDQAIIRWALELQCIPHIPYGNYLWLFLVEIKGEYGEEAVAIAQQIIGLGLGLSQNSGHFQSLDHLDPYEPAPSAADRKPPNLPLGNFIDNFSEANYDISYRYVKGRSSTILQLTYKDKIRLDLDIYTICDSKDPAQLQSLLYMTEGPAQRLIPLRMGPSTTPRLHRAKWEKAVKALGADADDYTTFASIGLAGVMSNLPVGYLPAPQPPVPTITRFPAQTAPPPKTLSPAGIENRGATPLEPYRPVRSLESSSMTKPTVNSNVNIPPAPKPSVTPRPVVNDNAILPVSGPGYWGAEGEIIGHVPASRLPTAARTSAPYGSAMESEMAIIVQQRFPRTRFRFNIGQGNTGPDVVWVSGEDPGFNIGDFKPNSDSGWASFRGQVRRIWSGGPSAPSTGTFRAAMIAYETDGTIWVGTVLTVTP